MNKLQKDLLLGLVVALLLSLSVFLILSGCSEEKRDNMIDESENHARFQILEKLGNNTDYDVIYVDTYTGVEYFVHHEDHGNYGKDSWGSVLIGADGLPVLAPGYSREGGAK